jgi:predicted ATPase
LDSLEDLIILRGSRLVALVGPGGIGKTRLALEFAARQLQTQIPPNQKRSSPPTHFPDGIFFISLELIASVEMIWTAIAEALRFRLDYGEIQLIEYLRSKKLLLVMDNFEQILDGAENLSRILRSAPNIHFLVTSREQLRLLEEQVYPLQGLEYPKSTTAESITDYPAGKLFFQTAQRQHPNFALDETEKETLAHICQQVEGMPLALELAAGWTDTLSISNICNEIQNNIDFLKTNYRNLPTRHHSLRAVFDVSWKKLLSAERELFSKLSMFRGGFTREAASQITGADLQSLAVLVHKSLLRYSKSRDRFSIHELLRQYGEQKLLDLSIDLKGLKDRHSQYYCNWFADQVNPSTMISKGQKAVLDGMSAELENTRAAWNWALQNQDLKPLLLVKTALGLYYAWRGGFKEGERTFQSLSSQLINSKSSQTADCMLLRADLLNWQAYYLNELGDRPKAIDFLLESQDLISTLQSMKMDVRDVQAHNLVNKSRAGWWQTSDDRKAQLNQALALYREGNSVYGLPYALFKKADIALVTGQMDEVYHLYEESLKIYERTGNLLGKAAVLNGLGNLWYAKNDYLKAENLLKQAMYIAGEIEDRQRDTSVSMSLGCVYLYAGQFEQALKLLEKCVAGNTEMGLKNRRSSSLYYLGYTCLHLGEYDQAVRYGATALRLAKETDYKEIIAQSMMLPAAIALTKGDSAEAMQRFQAARKEFVAKRFTRVLYGEDCGLLGLGAASLQLGRIDDAEYVFKDLLQQAVASHRQDQLLYALVGIAALFAHQGKIEQAIELDTLADSYPFVSKSHWFAATFGRWIEAARAELPSIKVEIKSAASESQDVWGTAEKLLLEFNHSKS